MSPQSVSVRIDPAAMERVLRSQPGGIVRRLMEDGEIVRQAARGLVGVSSPDPVPRAKPRRPGQLRDSIVKRLTSADGLPAVIVGSNLPYALYHHEGTQPHPITPMKAPFLVFWSGKAGKVVYAKAVAHPGTNPNRFLVNALAAIRGRR